MKDYTGQTVGGLLVLEFTGKYQTVGKVKKPLWRCECTVCHAIVEKVVFNDGRHKSCGCVRKAIHENRVSRRGNGEPVPLYAVWKGIQARCYNPKHASYKIYGAKGVAVCDEWLGREGFMRFSEWAYANGYKENANPSNRSQSPSIDRINPDGPYSPDNCRVIPLGENALRARLGARKNPQKIY